ncbi:DUF1048 domain-containing protein [Demequina capsici]|uniref:DUF1048 domain-containing protein n=1 Tax=Demequina capsici TaxID=3075620 RepID=A0AA96J8R2_9MICO|nr:DUF1048 domain-containing protein [Demequina sp. PMTSA13]WNM26472.1 DUF1048 domain-containing protein [Demequina sp. PMTSA13]
MRFTDLAEKIIGDKRRWRAYKARAKALPEPYRTAVAAIEKYMMNAAIVSNDADVLSQMFEDLADLFEQAAADKTPVHDIVGDDPVEFVETFSANYADGNWKAKAESRLRDTFTYLHSPDAADGDPS